MNTTIQLDWLNNYETIVEIIQKGTHFGSEKTGSLFSIVVANYNRAENLPTLIQSVRRQQYDGPVELIFVDDRSTDESISVLQSFPEVSIYRLAKNSGSEALPQNVGVYFAQSEYVGFIDSDDYLLDPDSIQIMAHAMKAHPNASMCISNIVFQVEGPKIPEAFSWIGPGQPGIIPFTNDNLKPFIASEKEITYQAVRKARRYSLHDLMVNTYHIGFRVFRKVILKEGGGWPLELRSCDDYGIVLNLAIREHKNKRQEIFPIDCDAYAYRITGDQATVNEDENKRINTFLVQRCKELNYTYQDLQNISSEQEQRGVLSIMNGRGLTKELFSNNL